MTAPNLHLPELYETIKEQEERRLASATSLILLAVGTVLMTAGAVVMLGVGAGLATLGLATYVVGVLIGRE